MTTTLPPASQVRPAPGHLSDTLLAAGLGLSGLTLAALVLLQPWGERNALDYQTLSADRELTWSTILLDGLAMAALGICLAVVLTRLVPGRGATLVRIGGTLTAAGGVLFAMGIYALGSLAWYATETAALAPADGAALLEYAVANPQHGMVVQVAGFLVFTLGSLLLCVALLRAGTVGRVLPVALMVLALAAFAAPSPVLGYVQAAHLVGLAGIGIVAVRRR